MSQKRILICTGLLLHLDPRSSLRTAGCVHDDLRDSKLVSFLFNYVYLKWQFTVCKDRDLNYSSLILQETACIGRCWFSFYNLCLSHTFTTLCVFVLLRFFFGIILITHEQCAIRCIIINMHVKEAIFQHLYCMVYERFK